MAMGRQLLFPKSKQWVVAQHMKRRIGVSSWILDEPSRFPAVGTIAPHRSPTSMSQGVRWHEGRDADYGDDCEGPICLFRRWSGDQGDLPTIWCIAEQVRRPFWTDGIPLGGHHHLACRCWSYRL